MYTDVIIVFLNSYIIFTCFKESSYSNDVLFYVEIDDTIRL